MILDTTVATALREAMITARSGDLLTARNRGEAILAKTNGGGVIFAFLGMVCCQSGDLVSGIRYLREALTLNPADIGSATNLTTALLDTNAVDDALAVCSPAMAEKDLSAKLWRFRGYILQLKQEFGEAAIAYERVVAVHADDVDAWNNLGNARVGAGDQLRGIVALRKAVALAPDIAPIRMNLAGALIDAELLDDAIDVLESCAEDFVNDPEPLVEMAKLLHQLDRPKEALAAIEQAVRILPNDADLQVRLGEQKLINSMIDGAEQAFRRAIALVPVHRDANLQLGMLLEQSNQIDALQRHIDDSLAVGTDLGIVQFLRVLILRREQRFEEGLELLKMVPEDIDPAKRGQLTGEFLDRLGRNDEAFAVFSNVNAILLADSSQPMARAKLYRLQIESDSSVVTQEWYRSWKPTLGHLDQNNPVFLVGFPRSGTTLLDTILMGHPALQILEERPALRRVADQIGAIESLAQLGVNQINQLRNQYYNDLQKYIKYDKKSIIIDKFPLYLNKVPYIVRIFPEAKFILSIRHPYDVALSCFITSFRLNNAMCNFLDMDNIVKTYDMTFKYWEKCRSIFKIDVHMTHYENVIKDSQKELQKILQFIGVDKNFDYIDHQKTALARGSISTASYSQVLEPIYTRGSGRWEQYKHHMRDAMTVVEPWVRHWGYST